MIDAMQEWVIYHPPKSVSFGHQSVPVDPRKAWSQLQQFLARVSALEFAHHFTLTCNDANQWTEPAVAERRIEEARALFGPERDIPEGGPHWHLHETQLTRAVQFALDDDKFPKQQMGPTRLYFGYSFLWPEIERLPYWSPNGDTRKLQSTIGVSLGGNKLFLQPHFVFPAPWHSNVLRDFLHQVEETVPFRFRNQYFKRSIPKQTKQSYHGKLMKLPEYWRGVPASSTP